MKKIITTLVTILALACAKYGDKSNPVGPGDNTTPPVKPSNTSIAATIVTNTVTVAVTGELAGKTGLVMHLFLDQPQSSLAGLTKVSDWHYTSLIPTFSFPLAISTVAKWNYEFQEDGKTKWVDISAFLPGNTYGNTVTSNMEANTSVGGFKIK